jgi:hypothetical protein
MQQETASNEKAQVSERDRPFVTKTERTTATARAFGFGSRPLTLSIEPSSPALRRCGVNERIATEKLLLRFPI